MNSLLFAHEPIHWCLFCWCFEVTPTFVAAFFAAGGGIAVNLITLLDAAKAPKAERPDIWSAYFWIPFLILPTLGAGLAAAYVESAITLSPIVAVNVGISAPLIIRGMINKAPDVKIPNGSRITPLPGA